MMMQFIQITFSFWQYATMMTIVLELVLHVLATFVHAQLVMFSNRLMATNVWLEVSCAFRAEVLQGWGTLK